MRAIHAAWRLLGRTVSWRVTALVLVLPLILVSCFAVPLVVPVDGIMYLASAKSLFGRDFGANFAWFREPGYPLLLRIIHLFGSDGLFIVIVQATFLGLAVLIALYSVRRMLGRGAPRAGVVVVTIFLALNPMYVIYGSLILQQALFALQLALFALGVVLALDRPSWLRRWVLISLTILNYVLSIWTSIGWIYLALFPVVVTITALFWKQLSAFLHRTAPGAKRIGVVLVAAFACIALTVVVYAGGVQAYSGWEAIKQPYLHHLTIPGSVIEPLTAPPRIPTAQEIVGRMLALMHMGTIDPYVSENNLFLTQQMNPNVASGQYDTAFVKKPYSEYAFGWISVPNSSNIFHFLYSLTAYRLSGIGYQTAFISFLVAIAASLIRRRWKLLIVLAAPFSFLAVYAMSNSPIDRYGIPAYPWAVASSVILFAWIHAAVIRAHSKRISRASLPSRLEAP